MAFHGKQPIKTRNKTSPYRGVKVKDGYISASIKVKGIRYFLGTFTTQERAAMAYDKEAVKLRGLGAITNF